LFTTSSPCACTCCSGMQSPSPDSCMPKEQRRGWRRARAKEHQLAVHKEPSAASGMPGHRRLCLHFALRRDTVGSIPPAKQVENPVECCRVAAHTPLPFTCMPSSSTPRPAKDPGSRLSNVCMPRRDRHVAPPGAGGSLLPVVPCNAAQCVRNCSADWVRDCMDKP
jgi:hypothetical protein